MDDKDYQFVTKLTKRQKAKLALMELDFFLELNVSQIQQLMGIEPSQSVSNSLDILKIMTKEPNSNFIEKILDKKVNLKFVEVSNLIIKT